MSETNGATPPRRRLSARRKTEVIDLELEDGTVKTLVVKELMGTGREEFMQLQASKIRTDAQGNPVGVRDTKGITVKLLSLGLYEPDAVEHLTEAAVRALQLPSRTEDELVTMITEMSALTKPAEEAAKN